MTVVYVIGSTIGSSDVQSIAEEGLSSFSAPRLSSHLSATPPTIDTCSPPRKYAAHCPNHTVAAAKHSLPALSHVYLCKVQLLISPCSLRMVSTDTTSRIWIHKARQSTARCVSTRPARWSQKGLELTVKQAQTCWQVNFGVATWRTCLAINSR